MVFGFAYALLYHSSFSLLMMDYVSERSLLTEPEDVEVPASRGDVAAIQDDGTILGIEELSSHGIGVSDIQKLKLAGICTVKGVNMTSKRSLLKVRGLSEAKVDKIKEAAAKVMDAGFISALEYSMRRAIVFKLKTGCDELDNLLGGNISSTS